MLFPSYKKAILGAVAYGNCLAIGECAAMGADNMPVYSLAKLSPGSLNPLGIWTKFRTWLREWGDVMALFCILIFFGTTAANLATIIMAAVKAGPTVAAGIGRRTYPHHLLRITLQEHKDNCVEKIDKEVKDKETGL
ncbi:MAG: hypothetical protein GY696_20165 [Gammaproteobacteria bacterium]|nr:hypothetical protein [Gammaproteobacteria bacterium]